MPLGPVHLVQQEQSGEQEATFYCGVRDAIAAIPPSTLSRFPPGVICPDCLRAYSETAASESTRSTE